MTTEGQTPLGALPVEGYFTTYLDAAQVVDGVLVPGVATLGIWDFNGDGVWADTGQTVQVTNCDEFNFAEADFYGEARIRSDNRWFPIWASCGPSDLFAPYGG